MVDFSSVNLRILSPDGKTVLAELQTIDRIGQGVVKRIASTQMGAITHVEQHTARAARNIAGNIAMIAATGEASIGSLKGIVSQGANIAFMFGTAGAIAGAVAVTGLAIYNFFARTRKEIEETAQKAREELEKLARGSDLAGAARRAQYQFSGDPFAGFGKHKDESDRAFEMRKLGLQGVRAQLEAARSRLAGADKLPYAAQQPAKMTAYNEIFRLVEMEKELSAEYARTMAVLNPLMKAEGERAKTALSIAKKPPEPLGLSEYGWSNGPLIPPARILTDVEKQWNDVAESIGGSFGQTLAQSISAGIEGGVRGGIGNGFRALTGAVLQGIGGMLQQIGIAALAGLQIIAKIKAAIMGFAPELGIPAAIGLIALGALLQSVGAGMGGGGGGAGRSYSGGYGGGGGVNTGQIINRGLINPGVGVVHSPGTIKEKRPIVFAPTIIGTNDPRAQRDLLELLDKAERRRG